MGYNIVLIIPTGIGAEIGGHSGDGNPVAKLLGGCCDNLITHPNVVNAADINEMPENTLYVEGSILDRFLEGKINLKPVESYNKILVVVNPPADGLTINSVSAARVTVGIDAEIVELETPLRMISRYEKGVGATGDVLGWEELIKQVQDYDFDALAIHTPIEVERKVILNYFRTGGINPWGGVEAKASKLIANGLDKPVAHAPFDVEEERKDQKLFFIFEEIVDPRIAPEALSTPYLHCVLKGLNRAPRIVDTNKGGLSVEDIDCMITPHGCFDRPHKACLEKGIEIIAVKENKTCLNKEIPEKVTYVENYWEAAGVIMCRKSGVYPPSVRRPLSYTSVKKKTPV